MKGSYFHFTLFSNQAKGASVNRGFAVRFKTAGGTGLGVG